MKDSISSIKKCAQYANSVSRATKYDVMHWNWMLKHWHYSYSSWNTLKRMRIFWCCVLSLMSTCPSSWTMTCHFSMVLHQICSLEWNSQSPTTRSWMKLSRKTVSRWTFNVQISSWRRFNRYQSWSNLFIQSRLLNFLFLYTVSGALNGFFYAPLKSKIWGHVFFGLYVPICLLQKSLTLFFIYRVTIQYLCSVISFQF